MTWIFRSEDLILSALGEAAILCQFPAGALDLERQKKIWGMADTVAALPAVKEVIPGMNNIVVIFDPFLASTASMSELMSAVWAKQQPKEVKGAVLEIPVVYGGKAGEDLPEIAEGAGLSVEDFVALHAGCDYTVYALGSQPGFAYLGGLDPRLASPRRSSPRPRVEAGVVMIGGEQTAVLSKTTPSGWNLIGRTDLEFFDARKYPPTLVSPGHRLRFVVKEIVL